MDFFGWGWGWVGGEISQRHMKNFESVKHRNFEAYLLILIVGQSILVHWGKTVHTYETIQLPNLLHKLVQEWTLMSDNSSLAYLIGSSVARKKYNNNSRRAQLALLDGARHHLVIFYYLLQNPGEVFRNILMILCVKYAITIISSSKVLKFA